MISRPQHTVSSHAQWTSDDWRQVTHHAAHGCRLLMIYKQIIEFNRANRQIV